MTFRNGGVESILNGCAGLHKSDSDSNMVSAFLRAALYSVIYGLQFAINIEVGERTKVHKKFVCQPCVLHTPRNIQLPSATITKRATYSNVRKCKWVPLQTVSGTWHRDL